MTTRSIIARKGAVFFSRRGWKDVSGHGGYEVTAVVTAQFAKLRMENYRLAGGG